ncbi:MAG: hypothetical protein ACHQ1D_12055, partial [Nitrososphaerales archaeon]
DVLPPDKRESSIIINSLLDAGADMHTHRNAGVNKSGLELRDVGHPYRSLLEARKNKQMPTKYLNFVSKIGFTTRRQTFAQDPDSFLKIIKEFLPLVTTASLFNTYLNRLINENAQQNIADLYSKEDLKTLRYISSPQQKQKIGAALANLDQAYNQLLPFSQLGIENLWNTESFVNFLKNPSSKFAVIELQETLLNALKEFVKQTPQPMNVMETTIAPTLSPLVPDQINEQSIINTFISALSYSDTAVEAAKALASLSPRLINYHVLNAMKATESSCFNSAAMKTELTKFREVALEKAISKVLKWELLFNNKQTGLLDFILQVLKHHNLLNWVHKRAITQMLLMVLHEHTSLELAGTMIAIIHKFASAQHEAIIDNTLKLLFSHNLNNYKLRRFSDNYINNELLKGMDNPSRLLLAISAGADTNAIIKLAIWEGDWTPLHKAAYQGFQNEILHLLLENGANKAKTLTTANHETPSSMSYHSQSSVVQAFRKEEIKNLINTWQAGDSPITKQTQKNITAKQM